MKATKITAWYIGLIIACLICLCSCSTSKKSKSVTKTTIDSKEVIKVDSSTLKTIDSVSVKKDNTVTTVEKSDNYEKETVIEFDTVVPNKVPSGIVAADYFPPVRKITIKEKGVKTEKAAVMFNKSDSAHLTTTDKTNITKESDKALQIITTTTTKIKSHSGLATWVWMGCLIVFVIWVAGALLGFWSWFGWFFFILGLFTRKKEEYQVKYKPKNQPK